MGNFAYCNQFEVGIICCIHNALLIQRTLSYKMSGKQGARTHTHVRTAQSIEMRMCCTRCFYALCQLSAWVCVCVSPRCCIKSVVIDTLPLRKLWRSQRQRQRQQQQQQQRQCGNNAARESAPLSFPPSPGEAEKEREREREWKSAKHQRKCNSNTNVTHEQHTNNTACVALCAMCLWESWWESGAAYFCFYSDSAQSFPTLFLPHAPVPPSHTPRLKWSTESKDDCESKSTDCQLAEPRNWATPTPDVKKRKKKTY